MKFGVRECANIVFRAKQPIRIGTSTFQTGQPVLYIDTATTSSMEQSTTTVYAQGGRGNARLLSWEGEKTLTFSFTDALLSPIGFAILSGAGLFKRGDGINSTRETSKNEDLVHFHMTSAADLTIKSVTSNGTTTIVGTIDLRNAIAEFGTTASICLDDAPIYIMETEGDGSLTGRIYSGTVSVSSGIISISGIKLDGQSTTTNASVMVDYYIDLPGKHVYEADITPDTFGGNYYVEADTLFRDQYTGKDLPANLTFPNVRLQSNFTITFAGSGDPSTFDFTMDAFPGYTYFDHKKKVLAVLQVVDSIALGAESVAAQADDPVMYDDDVPQHAEAGAHDSYNTTIEQGANITTFEFKNPETEGGTTKQVTLYHIKDAITFGSHVNIINDEGEATLSQYAPTWTIVYNDGTSDDATVDWKQYIDLSDDGYIVAKKNTPQYGKVKVTATLSQVPSAADTNNALTLEVIVNDASVAQG